MKFAELKKQAETQGNPDDLFQIAWVYEQGQYQEEVVDKNVEQAVYWYQLAANRGSSRAHLNLANLYYDGMQQPDWKLALLHYMLSADLGDCYGAYMSGYMYQQGQGIGTPDLKKATHYFHLAQKLLKVLSEETDVNAQVPEELRDAINNIILPALSSISEEDIKIIPSTTTRFAWLQKKLAVQHRQLLQQQGHQQAWLVKFKERERLRIDYLEKKQQYKKDLAENQAQLQLCDEQVKGLVQKINEVKGDLNDIAPIFTNPKLSSLTVKETYENLIRDLKEKEQQLEAQSTEYGNLQKIRRSLQESWQFHRQSLKAKLWEAIELPKEFPSFLELTSAESETPEGIRKELETQLSKGLSQEEDLTFDKEWQQQQEERQKLQATLQEKITVVKNQEVRLSQEKIKLEEEEKYYQKASETLKVQSEEYERKARELEEIQKENVTEELRSTYETKFKELEAERKQLEQERQQLSKEKQAIEKKKAEIKEQEVELQRLTKDLEDYKRREQRLMEKDSIFFNKVTKFRAELQEDNKKLKFNSELFDKFHKKYISRIDKKQQQLKQMETKLSENLFAAAREGNLQEISYRLSRGEDPNQKNSEGNTLLHYAARGNLELVKLLHKNPKTVPDIYSEDKRNPSPYEIAFHNGVSTEIVEILAKACQYTPLHRAVLERDQQKIKQLLNENEALIITQANDRSGRTPHALAEERFALNKRLSPELVAENESSLQEICNLVDFQKIAPRLNVKYLAPLQELVEKEISFIRIIKELTILLNVNQILIKSLPFLQIVEDMKNNIEKNLEKLWTNFGNITKESFSNQIQQLHKLFISKHFQNHIINSVVYYEGYAKKMNEIRNILFSLIDKKLISEKLRELDRDFLSIIFLRLPKYGLILTDLRKEYQLKIGNEKSDKTKLLIDEIMQWFENVYKYVILNRMPSIKDPSYEKHIKEDKQSINDHMKELCLLFEQQLKDKNKLDTSQSEKFLKAIQDGNLILLRELFDKGADVNAKDSGATKASMLHWAALLGKKSSVEFLLNKDADSNVLDADGESALQWAQKGLKEATGEEIKIFNDIIKLLQDKIISKPSMTSATSVSAKLIPQLTKGGGDCAFHALLGQWSVNEERFLCDNVDEQRKCVADAIRKCKSEGSLFSLVQEAIKAMVMENRQVKGEIKAEKFKATQEAYRQYQQNDIASMASAWTIFEKELQNYSDVIVYIENFITKYCKQKGISLDTLASLLKFSTCLNEDETLAGILLSIPELHKAHKEYNERCSQNFKWDEILADQEIINEYANFIATPGQWLLPLELHILAIVFNFSVEFYTQNPIQRNDEPIKLDTYNPGREKTVTICFNGTDHYEQMMLREPNLKKVGSLFFPPAKDSLHDPDMPNLIDESEDDESTQKFSQT